MDTNTKKPFCVSVLLYQDGDVWVAQCLQKDLAAQAPTKDEAKSRFMRTLDAQIVDDVLDGVPPLSKLSQAPKHFFNDLGGVRQSGPELPIYKPIEEKLVPQFAVFLEAA